MKYRVVVIGAGPGGAVLARELAKKGVGVTIYEKGEYEELGHDWSDVVERMALEAVGFEMPRLDNNRWIGSLVKKNVSHKGIFEPHAISRLKIFSPGYQSMKDIELRMITTDRRNLGKTLVDQAVEAGADIKYGYEGLGLLYREKNSSDASGVEVFGVKVKNFSTKKEELINADVVVESAGFNCVLRKSLPYYTGLANSFKDGEFALVHREVRLRDKELAKKDQFPDHYRYGFNTGYQWSHVHDDDRIDVGSGVRHDPTNPDPKDIIEEFISRHPSITDKKIRGGRSLCIVGQPLTNFVTNGFFVLGDAASTSVPTTGCGAGSAMLMGLWAAPVIAEAAMENRNDINKLWEINTKFYLNSSRGGNFAALTGLRSILQNLSHDDLDFLYRKDIMDRSTLQDTINGIFTPPKPLTLLKTLVRGFTRPDILLRLSKATGMGTKIIQHYKNYPEKWDGQQFYKWKKGAEKLFDKVSE
jgi:flavin-dependent dehydrogenase